MCRSGVAPQDRLTVSLVLDDLDGPQEVKIESQEYDEQGQYDPARSIPVADQAGLERMADDHVPLHRDRDDQPDGEVTDRVPNGRTQLAHPVGLIHGVLTPQLTDPQPQQADVEDQRIGHAITSSRSRWRTSAWSCS